MERSFLDYAMSVIVSARAARRARRPEAGAPPHPLRHVRSGLPSRSAAREVRTGHGQRDRASTTPTATSAIYDALARMAQAFSLRYPLIDCHGNFGSPDFDDRPAERYTECRLSPLAMQLLAGIDEDTVDFIDNYSGEFQGPDGAAGSVPEPAGQRRPGHRGRHGHEHPAAQPRRGHRRGRPPDRQSRRDTRRPHAVREGARLPDRRARFSDEPASSTPIAPVAARCACGRPPRSKRCKGGSQIVVTELPYQTSARRSRRASVSWRTNRRVEGIRSIDNFSAGDGTRLVIGLQARRERPRRAEQPLQAHTDADELRGQHGRPRRRRASHA